MKIEVRQVKSLEFSMDGESISLPVLFEFNFLYSGWELDYIGYIVEYCGCKRLVASDHDGLYLVPKDESVTYLKGFLIDYKNAIEKTSTAIDILLGNIEL